MARNAHIIAHAVDVYGRSWDIRERRPTRYGFDVLIGWPEGTPRGKGGRGVAAVPTQALIEYLGKTRLRDVDLPIGRTAVKRLRAEADIRWDWDAWWAARADDLRSMTLEQFCEKHSCSIGAASQRRATLTCHTPRL
jgi:hypothetical protein